MSPDVSALARFVIVRPLASSNAAEGRCSQAIWVVLEKFGLPDYTVVTWPDYRASCTRRGPHVVLLTAPAVAELSAAELMALEEAAAPILVEGPWPASLDRWAGLAIDRDGPVRTAAPMRVLDGSLGALLTAKLSGIKTPSNSGAFTGLDGLAVRERVFVSRRQSETVSAHAGANPLARQPSWGLRRTGATGGTDDRRHPEPMLCWGDEADGGVLLARRGRCRLMPWSLFSYLAEDYTAPAMHHCYAFSDDRYPLELMLIAELRRALREAFADREAVSPTAAACVAGLRLAPWPNGRQYALTVRHDVDRRPSGPWFKRLLEAERETNVGVSCYFLPSTAEPKAMQRFAESGAEIAWHMAHLEPDGPSELGAIIRHGYPRPVGFTVHGNAGFYGWRGAACWTEAERLGMAYAEHLSAMRYLPSRVFSIGEDGPVPYALICPSHHVSYDRNLTESFHDAVAAALPAFARNEMQVTLLNHPDIHLETLVTLLRRHCPAGFAGMTLAEIAAWWRATHVQESLNLGVGLGADGRISIMLDAREPVRGVTLELPWEEPPAIVRLDGRRIAEPRLTFAPVTGLAERCWRLALDLSAGRHTAEIQWRV